MAKYNKYVQMTIYGAPGVGKSTFASKAPNPLILATDHNVEWLGLNEQSYKVLENWTQFKNIAEKLNTPAYDQYDTIIVDLIEDLYSWCEQEVLKKFKIDHLSDLPYGKAYDDLRKGFFATISKLFTLRKHLIIVSHEITKVEKDRRGVETYKFYPSNVIPIDKKFAWNDIEGKCRFFLRAYTKAEEVEGGKLVKRRYLSIIPKENEYGISRGFDESNAPEDITLDWNTFCNILDVRKIGDEVEKQPSVMKSDVEEEPFGKVDTPSVSPSGMAKIKLPGEVVIPGINDPKPAPTPKSNTEAAKSTTEATGPALSQAERIAKIKAIIAAKNKK